RGDVERLQFQDALAHLGRSPGFVGVHAQIHARTDAAPDGTEAFDVVLAFNADLDLELAESIDPHLPRGQTCFHPLSGRDGSAVANALARLVQIRSQVSG